MIWKRRSNCRWQYCRKHEWATYGSRCPLHGAWRHRALQALRRARFSVVMAVRRIQSWLRSGPWRRFGV